MDRTPHSTPPASGDVRIIHLDDTDSTNSEAMRRARAGETGPLWIVARRQSAGRGRLGRTWESPSGNLYCTHLAELGCPPGTVQQLSLVAAVAVFEAVSNIGSSGQLRLKWPNDVVLDAAKLGGILVESTTFSTRRIAVIGVGINIASSPARLGREVTHLAARGIDVKPESVFAALAQAMQRWIDVWQQGAGFPAVRDAWIERAGLPGQPISIDTGNGVVAGTYVGLDQTGALLMRDGAGADRRFQFGEVSLLGRTDAGA